ncbi:DUF6069 family protein [Pseudonocardia nematodicida]|uniref:DUF6069 family protein n=1 Tax=Pseudonocardia nematodicida TaxID=1206997 RepID=A0ABV1KC44_9PSEU
MTTHDTTRTAPTVLLAGLPVPAGRAAGVAATVLVTLLVRQIGRFAGADYLIDDPVQPVVIGAGTTALVTLVLALLGWGLLAALERLTRHGFRIWVVIAVAVLALSMVPIFFIDATPATMTALYVVHLAVAVLIPLLRRRATLR